MKRFYAILLILATLLCLVPMSAVLAEEQGTSPSTGDTASESASYLDLYVKSGLVALFDAYGNTASSTAVTKWAPVDLYGKTGYSSYLDPASYTYALNGTWKPVDGALHSAYSGASFALSSLGALIGTTYSVQMVYGMTKPNGYTRADISTVTVDNGDGTTTTKKVINNYTSMSSGAKTLGTMKFGLLSYATMYAAQKYTSASRTLMNAWFVQLKGGGNKNMFFLGTGASNENGIRQGTYYYTNAEGTETSFSAYYAPMPAHIQEVTVSRLGDAVQGESKLSIPYSIYWQFYPNRNGGSPHSSHSLAYSVSGTTDSTTLTLLAGLEADNYSVRVYSRELATADINRNHLADLCGFYGTDVTTLCKLTDAQIASVADALSTVKLYHDRMDSEGYAAAKTAYETKLLAAVGAVLGDGESTYIDLYVKSGLVAIFDAYGNTASSTAVTEWTPVDFYGKAGYTAYLAPTAYALTGTWSRGDGAYVSGGSSAAFDLSAIGAGLGTTWSVQTVWNLISVNNTSDSTLAKIEQVTVDNGDGTFTTKNVVSNRTSLSKWGAAGGFEGGKSTYGPLTMNLYTVPSYYKSNEALIGGAYFMQINTSSSVKNLFFCNADYGMKYGTYHFTTSDGTESSVSAWVAEFPTPVMEQTVSRLGAGVAGDTTTTFSFRITYQFAPTKFGSTPLSARSFTHSLAKASDSTTLNVLVGKKANNYSVRIYNKELSIEEIDRNHLADLCGFYGVAAAPLSAVSDASIAALAESYATTKLLAGERDTAAYIEIKNRLQAEINALAFAEGGSVTALLDSLLSFESYSFRASGNYGIRAIFRLDQKAEALLEEKGYTLQAFGAVTAIKSYNGTEYNTLADLALTANADGEVSLGGGVRGAAITSSKDASFKTLSDDGEMLTFAYTVTYPTRAAAALYTTEMLYRGYAVLTNGEGEVTLLYADIPEKEQKDSLLALHKSIVAEYGVTYRDTLGYAVYCYLYDVLITARPDTYDEQTREKAWALLETVTHLQITQAERVKDDDYSHVQAYADFYRLAEKGAVLPGLGEGYVPQGLAYDQVGGYTYISAYHYTNATPSAVFVLDHAGRLVAEYTLYNEDGTAFTGHVGGVAVSERALYLSHTKGIAVVPLDELALGGRQSVTLSTYFSVPVGRSFLFYEDGVLWAGNYYVTGSSDYPLGKHFSFTTENADGKALGGYAAAYRLDGALMPTEETFTAEDGTEYSFAAPDCVIAIPDKVQGFAYKDGQLVLSTSLSSANSHLYFYTVGDPMTATDTVTLYGREYPLTVLSNAMLNEDVVALPMSEGMDFAADGSLLVSFESGASKFSYSYPTDNIWKVYMPRTVTEEERQMLDGKKIIFIGDSFIYWGQVVLDGSSSRYNDKGYFYQLCKANGIDVSVTNWTYGGTGITTIYNDYMDDLADYNYDYVVISGGRNSASSAATYLDVLEKYKALFTAANPNVKFFYNVSSGAHNISVAESFPIEILNNLDEFEKLGYTIVDWGKLVADIIRGKVEVPGGTVDYVKNTFAVHRSEADGYHPNQLTGYLTAQMVYSAITGTSAVGQSYTFWDDSSISTKLDPSNYIASNYTVGDTNYTEVFASPADMRGLQMLIDQYLEEKAYRDYNFSTEKSLKVLFIGNSYTYYNDMPTAIFEEMAEAAGLSLDVTAITNGGHTLEKYADPSDSYGAKVAAALNGDVAYDYVILQEQSVRPALDDPSAFYEAVRDLAARVRAVGATPILYATWGRKTGSDTLSTYGWTNESMTWRLAASYAAIGAELNIPVAYAGLAFYDVYTSEAGIELYNADLSHPSYAGSYLAAATLLAKIFDIDPTGINYVGALTAENAAVLLAAAKAAVYATPEIPEEYLK